MTSPLDNSRSAICQPCGSACIFDSQPDSSVPGTVADSIEYPSERQQDLDVHSASENDSETPPASLSRELCDDSSVSSLYLQSGSDTFSTTASEASPSPLADDYKLIPLESSIATLQRAATNAGQDFETQLPWLLDVACLQKELKILREEDSSTSCAD